MPKLERYALYAILIAAALLFYFKGCNIPNDQTTTVKLTYDSIPKSINTSTIEKPVVYKAGEINIPAAQLTVLQSTDTALLRQVLKEVLARYYEVNVQLTTTADTNIIINTFDTISENKLIGRHLEYKWLNPTTVTTIVPQTQRNKVFLGVYLEAGVNGMYNVAPQISLENKKGMLLSVNYNCYNLAAGRDKYSFGVSLSQKIRLR